MIKNDMEIIGFGLERFGKMASIRTTQICDVIEIKKVAQIYGHRIGAMFLTNHSSHPDCSYPKLSDSEYIIQPGTKLVVIHKGKAETKFRQSYVTVVHNQHEFDIMASDLRRFCK